MADEVKQLFEELANSLGLKVIVWRNVPRDKASLGEVASSVEPFMMQPFVTAKNDIPSKNFDRKVFMLRKIATHQIASDARRFYICSLSTKTVVYKGQVLSHLVFQSLPRHLHSFNSSSSLLAKFGSTTRLTC